MINFNEKINDILERHRKNKNINETLKEIKDLFVKMDCEFHYLVCEVFGIGSPVSDALLYDLHSKLLNDFMNDLSSENNVSVKNILWKIQSSLYMHYTMKSDIENESNICKKVFKDTLKEDFLKFEKKALLFEKDRLIKLLNKMKEVSDNPEKEEERFVAFLKSETTNSIYKKEINIILNDLLD